MASKKAALGRGLNALLPPQSDEDSDEGRGERADLYRYRDRRRMAGRVAEVELENVGPNPYQPRKEFDETALDELASSIEQLGIIQPITVRVLSGGRFEVISGERRLRAARRAGLKRIPAYIRDADTEEMLEMALVENVQREELNPVEVAHGYQRLMEECDLTQEEVAKKVGKSRATVANMLRLLKLPPRIQASLRNGSITIGHARALITVEDDAVQLRILRETEEKDLSVRDVEDRVRDWRDAKDSKEQESAPSQPAVTSSLDREALQVKEFAQRLRSRLSTQVAIKRKSNGGRVEIAFYSDDDLERIIELIAG